MFIERAVLSWEEKPNILTVTVKQKRTKTPTNVVLEDFSTGFLPDHFDDG